MRDLLSHTSTQWRPSQTTIVEPRRSTWVINTPSAYPPIGIYRVFCEGQMRTRALQSPVEPKGSSRTSQDESARRFRPPALRQPARPGSRDMHARTTTERSIATAPRTQGSTGGCAAGARRRVSNATSHCTNPGSAQMKRWSSSVAVGTRANRRRWRAPELWHLGQRE
ncbi:hypothetical protein DENSPDRAFT_156362 [Dentipellis sp. KUC8613]|nr:hypothetical protein DENSPDRAFT_156362 [Dentipellis sp. KUC8613]